MTTLLSLLLACGTTTSEPEAPPAPAPAPVVVEFDADDAETHEVWEGDFTYRLHTAPRAVKLEVLDTDDAPIAATGQVKLVLTGTGEEPQELVLQPSGKAWMAAAKGAGAPGYIAALSLELDGRPQSAKIAWGEFPVGK